MILAVSGPAAAQEVEILAESLDLSHMQAAADEMSTDINIKETMLDVLSGQTILDGDFLDKLISDFSPDMLVKMRNTFSLILLPLLVHALIYRLLPKAAAAAELMTGCAAATIFIGILSESLNSANELLSGMSGMIDAALPVLTSLSAMGGGTASAAMLSPMTMILGDVMVNILGNWGIGVAACAAVCACASAIGPQLKLGSITALCKRVVQVGCGLMLALFAGLLKVQGMLGQSFDSAAVKTARFAIDKIVPSVGGGIADTMDAAISSVLLVKSAVGVTGMAALLLAALKPILNVTSALLGMRLACAICQPIGDSPLIKAASEFGDVLRLLIVICAAALTMCLVLTGAAIGAGRGVAG